MGNVAVIRTDIDFAECRAELRSQASFSQQALADRMAIHVSNIRRYESGTGHSTLDDLGDLAPALNCGVDLLLPDARERGPGDDLRLQFKAASTRLDDERKAPVRTLIEGVLLCHEAGSQANTC